MALSNDLISQFVKATQDNTKTNTETTAYGKIVVSNGVEYVQLDGSDLLTPISSTTVVNDGDRVIVAVKNHTATVTGDLTNPSASNKDVQEIGNKIDEFEIVIADKVNTSQLEAEIAKIEELRAEDLEATNAKIETIEGKVAEIDTIKADVIEVEGKVSANEADITTLRSDIADFKNATAENFEATNADIYNLNADYASFKKATATNLDAVNADIDDLEADQASFKTATAENFAATNADISNLEATHAAFETATAENFAATNASITDLETTKLDATTANIKYATIDFSNIGEAAIEKLFSDSGIIKDLIMSDGKVTGELVGVTIKGDLIEGNTVKADKLVIQGEDGLYYKLNVNALGETTAASDEKYQNGLDGSVIVAESITAEKIAVDDLVAFGATIGGFHIDTDSIYSGVKNSIDNTTRGIFLGDDGQINIGDSSNYLKFYVDENGTYKLELQANSIKFGASGTTVEEAINDLSDNIHEELVDQRADILATTESVILQATADYVVTGDFESYKKTVESQLQVMSDNITMKFTTTTDAISDLESSTSEFETIVKKYFQFTEDGLIMGSDASAIKLTIDNDEGIVFSKNGDVFGYWDGDNFYTGNIKVRVNERAQFGNYAYVPRSDGSLMFLRVE